MTRAIVVDHLARIEGHAGITVEIDGDRVEQVRFDIFEGLRLFEGLVRGRPVVEVAGIVSRICAICSGGHAITALEALERAMGIEVSRQTERLRELAFHGANIERQAADRWAAGSRSSPGACRQPCSRKTACARE